MLGFWESLGYTSASKRHRKKEEAGSMLDEGRRITTSSIKIQPLAAEGLLDGKENRNYYITWLISGYNTGVMEKKMETNPRRLLFSKTQSLNPNHLSRKPLPSGERKHQRA